MCEYALMPRKRQHVKSRITSLNVSLTSNSSTPCCGAYRYTAYRCASASSGAACSCCDTTGCSAP